MGGDGRSGAAGRGDGGGQEMTAAGAGRESCVGGGAGGRSSMEEGEGNGLLEKRPGERSNGSIRWRPKRKGEKRVRGKKEPLCRKRNGEGENGLRKRAQVLSRI